MCLVINFCITEDSRYYCHSQYSHIENFCSFLDPLSPALYMWADVLDVLYVRSLLVGTFDNILVRLEFYTITFFRLLCLSFVFLSALSTHIYLFLFFSKVTADSRLFPWVSFILKTGWKISTCSSRHAGNVEYHCWMECVNMASFEARRETGGSGEWFVNV